jgi:glucokinase
MQEKIIIIWDLGATKCALGIVRYQPHTKTFYCQQHFTTPLREHDSLDALIAYLEQKMQQKMHEADAILIAAAGIYAHGRLEAVNPYPFLMDFDRVAKNAHWPFFQVVHDYVPVIAATFLPESQDAAHVQILRNGQRKDFARRLVFGLGTGLGIKDGVLLPQRSFWLGNNEFGHIGIPFPPLASAAEQQRHEALLAFIQLSSSAYPAITFESILSGRGITHLHQFATQGEKKLKPHEVGQLLQNGLAEDTLALFAWYLGLLISTLELAFMPAGGIWMTGGILQKHFNVLLHPELQRGMVAVPAYWETRQLFPLAAIKSETLVFLGGAYYAIHYFDGLQ